PAWPRAPVHERTLTASSSSYQHPYETCVRLLYNTGLRPSAVEFPLPPPPFPLTELNPMIIDCHGHYTTAPKQLQDYRDAQIAALKNPTGSATKGVLNISDDELRESVQPQLNFQRER